MGNEESNEELDDDESDESDEEELDDEESDKSDEEELHDDEIDGDEADVEDDSGQVVKSSDPRFRPGLIGRRVVPNFRLPKYKIGRGVLMKIMSCKFKLKSVVCD